MRWRVYLSVSLAINFLLAAGWLLSARIQRLRYQQTVTELSTNTPVLTRTNVLINRQYFSWRQVESTDYPTYVANLRAIGCPEQTVRDIIIADINALYARKRATEIVTPEQQWWRSEPDTNVLQIAIARLRELDRERRGLLARLLGPGWESGDLVSLPRPSRPTITLDGPVLGVLPTDIKQKVGEINARLQERIQAYTEAQRAAGQPVNPVELARLRQQTRNELAGILSPLQLEEYLLRYSEDASALRSQFGQLKYFNATPDEFRAVFEATDAYDQQLQMLAGATDSDGVAQRRALETQRLEAIKNALGPDRFAQYQLLQDPAYRDAYATAQAAGSPESALVLYQINQAAAQESARIQSLTNLTAEQRAIELKKAELKQLEANAVALGQTLPTEPPMPPQPPPATVHVMKPGEGLSFLSRLYGVNPGDLRAANPNLNLDHLKAGDSVSVPINLLPAVPALPSQ